MGISAERVAEVLGGREALGTAVLTLAELRRTVERGLPVRSLDTVARRVAGNDRDAAEIKYRIVPKSTLARRTRLTPEESERLERLARLTALAEQVWEDDDRAHESLHATQPHLGGERPLELARSDLGARQVEDLLFRIEHALPV
jgi:putative toxin-antitoxin system antitoxin component (TIGR02293 family)